MMTFTFSLKRLTLSVVINCHYVSHLKQVGLSDEIFITPAFRDGR